MSVPYAGSENITVLPQNYLSTGTGGNTAQYESTGLPNNASMKGGFISQHQPKSRRGKTRRGKYGHSQRNKHGHSQRNKYGHSQRNKHGHSQRNKPTRNKHGRHHRR